MPTFCDTNILVYIFDDDVPDKQRLARKLWRAESAATRAGISTQVLQEFYATVTRKLIRPPSAEAAERAVRGFAAAITAGATRLWTEDLQHGQRIDGLEVVNPFRNGAAG